MYMYIISSNENDLRLFFYSLLNNCLCLNGNWNERKVRLGVKLEASAITHTGVLVVDHIFPPHVTGRYLKEIQT